MGVFDSDKIITHFHKEKDFSTFYVGFDLDDDGSSKYRFDSLINVLVEVIPEFAYGFHKGKATPNTQIVSLLRDSARSIYKIDAFRKVREKYETSNSEFEIDDKYLKRGEFGELILHLLLRDFFETIPLISKIYFKDNYGSTVHGFDAVHIQPSSNTLWLGESKLYSDGKRGIAELINDLTAHFKRDYLNEEFSIISKKLEGANYLDDVNYWNNLLNSKTKLKDQLNKIRIPLLCTYTDSIFTNYNEECSDFLNELEIQLNNLNNYFKKNNNHPLNKNLEVILILFPVKSKYDLVKSLHKELALLSGC